MSHPESSTIILGAGFVGLFTALHLVHRHYPAPIILVDKSDRFSFKPLLYEYLSGELTPNEVVPSYTTLLKGSGVQFIQDTVEHIDLQQQQVQLGKGSAYPYSNLVLALGSVPAFFAEGASDHALTFQSKVDVDRLREHLQSTLHRAAQSTDAEERQHLLTTTIVGGGPAGVELSMTLGDVLPEWYRDRGGNPAELKVVLLNRGDILAGDINSHLRAIAKQSFQKRKIPIEFRMGASVTAIRPGVVEYTRENQAEQLAAGTIVWTAGTTVNPLIKMLPIAAENRTKRGQVHVLPTLQLPEYPAVFAAGDCAVVVEAGNEQRLPATAQVAYQQGATIAHNLLNQVKHLSLQPAQVSLRGTLMKLGFDTAVANLFDRYEITGKAGQLIREGTYLGMLPTPLHDFKASEEWFVDELFDRHAPNSL
ncbi:NAD(P)/FAD-dependent oxidoreductase [Kovacikia minuta CCNUW1]|uniref:NAD(P)/FAD-dependent oxidoreductase n=1 Tax=Kovacikia minuta TaxID=2931930 RepID=UPI001CCE5818|nr:NAD(P)/FAD-dependent oxidoreductase [Kovacikia minuta]UBF29313.1 NAD(P)/FAD-dependent oxidoreductase [Kovacikia minuta CCNUW1]